MNKNGVACYYDFHRSAVVEYCYDASNQKVEILKEVTENYTSFSSKKVGEVIVEVTKIQEITAHTIDEFADLLISLNKQEYLIQRHPHLSSFLPNCEEVEILEENLNADFDLLNAVRKKQNFKLTASYKENPTTNKALIILAKYLKDWFLIPENNTRLSFCSVRRHYRRFGF